MPASDFSRQADREIPMAMTENEEKKLLFAFISTNNVSQKTSPEVMLQG